MDNGGTFLGNVDSFNNDVIGGWIYDPARPTHVFEVELIVDGVTESRIRAQFPRPDIKAAGYGSGENGFYFALPPTESPRSTLIEVREVDSQLVVGSPLQIDRQASFTRAELSRRDAMAMVNKPLVWVGVDCFLVAKNRLTLKGNYLPPGGDPFAYEVKADTDIEFHLRRPKQAADAGAYFWFWPNVQWSGWEIDVDLGTVSDDEKSFRFTFVPLLKGERMVADTLVVPKDLRFWQRIPPTSLRDRVQIGDYSEASPIRAATHSSAVADLARRHGSQLEGLRVLDWGCGWGRLTRMFVEFEHPSEMWGADIDEENLEWARAGIPTATFVHLPRFPPTPLPDGFFDVVVGVSVMTHLTREAQQRWLEELARILRPGGIAILTFHGLTQLAFSSQFLDGQLVSHVLGSGFDDSMDSSDLDDVIDPGYYKLTFQTGDDVTKMWTQHFDVLEIAEAAVGTQDAVVLRRRAS